jgi:hypothetical protein
MNEFFDMLAQERQKIKSQKLRSPVKKSSPLKKSSPTKENSPLKEQRSSQRRKNSKKDDSDLGFYLQEIKQDSSEKQPQGSLQSCRKSPLKRMRNLEE